MATPELDLLPAVEEPEDDEAEDEGMELKRNILQLLIQETYPAMLWPDINFVRLG